MTDPTEIATTVGAGALGMKLLDYVLARFSKKEDQTEKQLIELTKALSELKSSVDLARAEFQAGLNALTEKHTRLDAEQAKQNERLNGGLGDHSRRLHSVEERVTRVETIVEERLPRNPLAD
jgi:chromosome segregation ATPase